MRYGTLGSLALALLVAAGPPAPPKVTIVMMGLKDKKLAKTVERELKKIPGVAAALVRSGKVQVVVKDDHYFRLVALKNVVADYVDDPTAVTVDEKKTSIGGTVMITLKGIDPSKAKQWAAALTKVKGISKAMVVPPSQEYMVADRFLVTSRSIKLSNLMKGLAKMDDDGGASKVIIGDICWIGRKALAMGKVPGGIGTPGATAGGGTFNDMCPVLNKPVNPKITITSQGKIIGFC